MATEVQIIENAYKGVSDHTSVENEDIPGQINKSIKSIIESEGYLSYNVVCTAMSTGGGNYLGELYLLDIKGKTVDGDKESNIFIKFKVPGDKFKLFSITTVYERESFVYKELSKTFEELQNTFDVPPNERFHLAKSYDQSNSEMIVLENLAKQGFKTLYRMDVFSLKFAELSVEKLAKYHSLSYVMQKYKTDYFEKKVKSVNCLYIFDSKEWKESFENLCMMTCANLSYEKKKIIEQNIPTMSRKIAKYLTDETSVGCALCHGDFRVNNILMKEMNGEASVVMPVDYQHISYCCPLNDFFFFIYSGSDRQFRKDHLNHLKELYYETMKRFLHYFDLDINEFYPRKEFERQYEERLDYGLISSMLFLPFCFAAEDDVPDLAADDMGSLDFKLDPRVKDRVAGLVDEFIEYGHL